MSDPVLIQITEALNAYQLALRGSSETPPFVGTFDQWLASLKGVKGDKGDKGDQGDQGDVGPPNSWGNIGGVLSNQTDLQEELDGKSDVGHTHTLGSLGGFGVGVQGALAINLGFVGSVVTRNGDLGTPLTGNAANLTGYATSNLSGLGTGVVAPLGQNPNTTNGFITGSGLNLGVLPATLSTLSVTGTAAFGGQVSLNGQTASSSASAMSRGLCDVRYLRMIDATAIVDEVGATNTGNFQNSTQCIIPLGVGKYIIEVFGMVAAASGTSMSKLATDFTGAGTDSALIFRNGASSTALGRGAVPANQQDGTKLYTSTAFFNAGGNLGGVMHNRFIFNVTTAGDMRLRYGAAVAVSGEAATLLKGSFLQATYLP